MPQFDFGEPMRSTLVTGANVRDGVANAGAPLQVLIVDGRIRRIANRSCGRRRYPGCFELRTVMIDKEIC
jgi:hypothetical protein